MHKAIQGEMRHVELNSRHIYVFGFVMSPKTEWGILSEVIPVTGRGGPQSCETSRLPHFLDNRLTDGGEVK
jgi:hypothetical protein